MAREHLYILGCLFLWMLPCIICTDYVICDENWQVQIDASLVVIVNDTIEANERIYLKGEYKKGIGDKYIVCPCSFEICMHRCTNNENDNGASLEAIKKAVEPSHHYVYPCVERACFNREDAGYITLHENRSRNFFNFIYTLDEPYKFDHKQVHEYTVNANESFPIDEYADDSRYCYRVENGKIEIYYSIKNATLSKLIRACMFLSAVSLALLLAALVISRETLHMHCRCIAYLTFSMMIVFAASSFTSFIIIFDFPYPNFMCFGIAYIDYYFIMSSSFWLNVICFDMFWTFWFSAAAVKDSSSTNLKRLKFYSLYAWLGSLVLTILFILASLVLDESHPLFPLIGEGICFGDVDILNPRTKIAFYYGPQLVLLVANFAFFIITLIKIQRMPKSLIDEALSTASPDTVRICNKRTVIMNITLFAIIGGSLIMDSISWYFADNMHIMAMIAFDMFSALRGLWLLIVCVLLNKHVRTTLWRKCFCNSVISRPKHPTQETPPPCQCQKIINLDTTTNQIELSTLAGE